MNSIQKKLRIISFALGSLLVLLVGYRIALERIGRRPVEPAPVDYGSVANFKLVERSGQPFELADLKGKYWVADFFFTRCMGPCPVLTSKMAELQRQFSKKSNLAFVSFSVDPGHDSPTILSKCARSYGAKDGWYFLTGEKEKIYKLITTSFHLAVEQKDPSLNDVLHSLHFVLVDPSGKILGYTNTGNADEMQLLRNILTNLPT